MRSEAPLPPAARGLVLLLVGLVGGAMACGPSFQAIYEGNTRFEHCYALEENPQRSMPEKASCWRDWSEHYTYGQTRDRIHYATARYVALSQAGNAPTDEALMMAAPGETPRLSTITAPAPTDAFAPPPKVLAPGEAKPSGSSNGVSTIPLIAADAGAPPLEPKHVLPASSCADGCGGAYRGCSGSCDGADGGTSRESKAKVRACRACLKKYRACMRDCFK